MPSNDLSAILKARRDLAAGLSTAVLQEVQSQATARRAAAQATFDSAQAAAQAQKAAAQQALDAARAQATAKQEAAQQALNAANAKAAADRVAADAAASASRTAALVTAAAQRTDAFNAAAQSNKRSNDLIATAITQRTTDLARAEVDRMAIAQDAAARVARIDADTAALQAQAQAKFHQATEAKASALATVAHTPIPYLDDGGAVLLITYHGNYAAGTSQLGRFAQHPVQPPAWQHLRILRVMLDSSPSVHFGDTVALQLLGGMFVTAWNNHTVVVSTDKLLDWEKWTILDPSDLTSRLPVPTASPICLKSFHGRYLSAQRDGTMIADRTEVKTWETFSLTMTYSCTEVLKAPWWLTNHDAIHPITAHGTQLAATPFRLRLSSRSPSTVPAQRFEVVDADGRPANAQIWYGSRVGLKMINGYYLSARPSGELAVFATVLDTWETWTLVHPDRTAWTGPIHPDAPVAFRSYHGRYLCAQSDGTFVADRTALLSWEHFTLRWSRDRWFDPWWMRNFSFFFLTTYHGARVAVSEDQTRVIVSKDPHPEYGAFRAIHAFNPNTNDPICFGDQIGVRLSFARYVTANPDGRLSTWTDHLQEWERWTILDASDVDNRSRVPPGATIHLRSYHGGYLCAHPDGTFTCDAEVPSIWEHFLLDWLPR